MVRRRPPAMTPEGQEQRLIAMAMDYAEQQFANGTASSQMTVHFLREGSERARLEKENMRLNQALIAAKTESLQSAKKMDELYREAFQAFTKYSGQREEVVIEDA